jgi:hypothetical protein
VVLLVINNDPRDSRELVLPNASSRFTLDAATLQDGAVRMNGTVLAEGALDRFPEQAGIPTDPGLVRFAPATITFLVISGANNDNCR